MGAKCVRVGANSNGGSDRVERFRIALQMFRVKTVVKLSSRRSVQILGCEAPKSEHSCGAKMKPSKQN